jgi:hypothetical protein
MTPLTSALSNESWTTPAPAAPPSGWLPPTRDRADHLVGLLADYDYSSLRYYGDDGVADVQ